MDVCIDGVPFLIRHGDSLPRQEQLDVVLEELAARGVVLKEIVAHGEAMGDEGFLSLPCGVSVNFISDSKEALCLEVLAEVQGTAEECHCLADRCLKGQGAMGDEIDWTRRMEWLVRVLFELGEVDDDHGWSDQVQALGDALARWRDAPVSLRTDGLRIVVDEMDILMERLSQGGA
ncbi:MAG: hypothetical protein CSA35_09250 [Dethiosulfovibrio peptidovorans]|nr:MAG: hypothetical protein CSA35_09250 [Dethiosulfovibrio peptidovorans]